jgi:hypothetical protein
MGNSAIRGQHMKRIINRAALAAALAASLLGSASPSWAAPRAAHQLAVSDAIPSFNVEPACRGAASAGDGLDVTLQRCLQDEQDARKELQSHWTTYPLQAQRECAVASSVGGDASYVELLECLIMSRDAAEMKKQHPNDFQ